MMMSSRKRKKNSNNGDDSSRIKRSKKRNDDDLVEKNTVVFSKKKQEEEGDGSSKRKKKKMKMLKEGDTVNLSEILFTKDRDHLITYDNRNQPVRAEHLKGKTIVLHFVALVPWAEHLRLYISSLVDIYNALYPFADFEVVFIGVKMGKLPSNPQTLLTSSRQKYFEEKFSIMPWTAIPFKDIVHQESLERRLRLPVSRLISPHQSISVVINPTGVVLIWMAEGFFLSYGARAYPFTDKRIRCLKQEDKETRKHPSITKLLTTFKRDHVINNKNEEVPVHHLEDKVVALYFYEEDLSDHLTIEIQTAYQQLLAKKKKFEIVLVYVHDSLDTYKDATEESFWERFRKMPWLALPFKDPRCKYLKRVFNYPVDLEGPGPDPRLVIVEPHGKPVELYGLDILKNFGIKAYPFTRNRVVELDAKYIKKLKLDMFWDPNTSFIQKNGPKVMLSQLVGKRIILILESPCSTANPMFWRKLKARYLKVKDTNDAFEVIRICSKEVSSYGKHVVATMSWLSHPPLRLGGSNIGKLLFRLFRQGVGLLAFDRDGTVVRRSLSPSIERGNKDFPFYSGDLEKEALMELTELYDWDYWTVEL